jgi:hypothetical protein
MTGDLTEKIQASQNKFEQLVSRLPGYSGYKAKEQRREADELLRLQVARRYEEQHRRLGSVQYNLSSQGRLDAMMSLERAGSKLQLLIDRLRSASYGYAGWFDAIKVDEEALDRLYDFDRAMLDGVDEIAALLDRAEDAAQSPEYSAGAAAELTAAIERLNNTFSQRQDAIIG